MHMCVSTYMPWLKSVWEAEIHKCVQVHPVGQALYLSLSSLDSQNKPGITITSILHRRKLRLKKIKKCSRLGNSKGSNLNPQTTAF